MKIKKAQVFLSIFFVSCFSLASEIVSLPEKEINQRTEQRAEREVASVISLIQVREYVSDQQALPYYYTSTVRNLSASKPAYVTAKVYRVNNPGEQKEDLTPETLLEGEVRVIPDQIVIPAGGRRGVKVYLSEKIRREKDQYYRVRFTPSPVESEKDSLDVSAVNKTGSSMYLGVGVGQILFVGKNKPGYKSHVRIEKGQSAPSLVVDNQGDSYLRIENMKICYKPDVKKSCTYFSSNHVIAGTHKQWLLDNTIKTIELELLEGESKRKVLYDSNHPEVVKFL